MQALRVAGDVRGQRVLVMGPGTIGQGIAVLAAAPVRRRWWSAASTMRRGWRCCGAWASRRWSTCPGSSLADATRPHTGGEPFDIVFEATGVPETITERSRCCAATASSSSPASTHGRSGST